MASTEAAPESLEADPEFNRLYPVLQQYCAPDRSGTARLIARCREKMPGATIEEIVAAVHAKGPAAKHVNNPFGFLIQYVPECYLRAASGRSEFVPGSKKYRRVDGQK
jgi:hypothetical protein